ncbi:hypothetical protein DRO58_01770 [Candidatus Bathyarchaeota archaeon]|nr:MAG: hypothetical protein DRO58_01770 [Candidatus Bathyarchaeota archaeon]
MRSKGLMGVFGLLVVMLSLLGIAYSAWRDTVVIEGTVEMGELIVGILKNAYGKGVHYKLNETTNCVPEEDFHPAKPWVANTTIILKNPETSKHHTPKQTVYKTMKIKIKNAYPQYDVHIKFKLKNAGTIPAVVTMYTNGTDTTDVESLSFPSIAWNETEQAWVAEGSVTDEAGHEIAYVKLVAKVPQDCQLEPCNEYEVELHIKFKQEAEECHTYTFKITIEAIQWNKAGELE